jgi:hypothetical protein
MIENGPTSLSLPRPRTCIRYLSPGNEFSVSQQSRSISLFPNRYVPLRRCTVSQPHKSGPIPSKRKERGYPPVVGTLSRYPLLLPKDRSREELKSLISSLHSSYLFKFPCLVTKKRGRSALTIQNASAISSLPRAFV